MERETFVFVVCGGKHAERLNISLRFLKAHSRADIVVVKTRTNARFDWDQVMEVPVPARLTDHQASIFAKTSLHRILAGERRRFCYLDTDVTAVHPDVDTIFGYGRDPITFARDHHDLRRFSRFAVNCGCEAGECDHLQRAVRDEFGVDIASGSWRHWNGGVFVFSEAASEFMELWHQYTLSVFGNPYWKIRDQGTLAAAAWKLGLQGHPVLPWRFNCIVDPFRRSNCANREAAAPNEYFADDSYTLGDSADGRRPMFLHFINDGLGKRGWKNWDDAERLLEKNKRPASLQNG